MRICLLQQTLSMACIPEGDDYPSCPRKKKSADAALKTFNLVPEGVHSPALCAATPAGQTEQQSADGASPVPFDALCVQTPARNKVRTGMHVCLVTDALRNA